jgi:hypothetical protein
MTIRSSISMGLVALGVTAVLVSPLRAGGQQKPTVQIPNPGTPQIMTMEGKFVRAAYNNEAYVILGYQIANRTIGNEWIMLDTGMTLMEKIKDYTLKREAVSLDTPDGHLELPSIKEYRENEGKVQALQQRLKVQRDSIDYFPPWVHGVNRLGFFSDLNSRAMPWDQVEVSNDRACMGQLYFHIPGGTKYGQYWLNITFAQTTVRVPFRLLTEEEEKMLGDNFGDIQKQIKEAFKPKKK